MTVYLLHFAEPYQHAQHYLGVAEDLKKRLTLHAMGKGARLMEVITEAGIDWHLARTWEGDRKLERQLQNWHNSALLCPHPECSGKAAHQRGNFNQKKKQRRNPELSPRRER